MRQLLLQKLDLELKALGLRSFRRRETCRQLLQPTVQAIVLVLEKLRDLTKTLNIGLGRDIDHDTQ